MADSCATLAALVCAVHCAGAQTGFQSPACVYTLVSGSQILETNTLGTGPVASAPLAGTFELNPELNHPMGTVFALGNLSFTGTSTNGQTYRITGSGSYQITGEVAPLQEVFLQLTVVTPVSTQWCALRNPLGAVTRLWPMIQVALDQTNDTGTSRFHLDINAAPYREFWFSTVRSFEAGIWNPPTNLVTGGELLSSAGRLVKRNQELTERLGIQPIVPNLGLKDVDVLPGGDIVFSAEEGVFSETLGALSSGDLLSAKGTVFQRNAELISALVPSLPTPDVGVAVVQVAGQKRILFSVETNFFSEKLGRQLSSSDLLSSTGTVVRSGEQLLARFGPAAAGTNFGLRAIFAWPSGEIWFSTRNGFSDTNSVFYAPGDLLSDQGYVVRRNAELMSAFQPPENTGDLGLDALYVVSDAVPPGPAGAQLSFPTPKPSGAVEVNWTSDSKVFQVERALNAAGPFMPVSPLTLDRVYADSTLTNQTKAFYRLHQW